MNIERLKKEIEHQTRNGKKEVYIRIEDLKELVDGLEGKYGDNRMFVEADYVEELIEEYEKRNSFKNSLKVDVNTKLVKQDGLNFEFEEIER
jgi:hypothetical protein